MKSAWIVLALGFLAVTSQPATAQTDATIDRLAGTWILVGAERETADGEPQRTRTARGVLILDRAGNVFEFFNAAAETDAGLPANGPQRTLAEFGGFWGTFNVNDANQRLQFNAADGVSPDVQSLRFAREFELDGDLLSLSSTDEPQAQANLRWTWQRMPDVVHLDPVYEQVVGFWQHVEERQVNQDTGEVQRTSLRAPSVIVYTPSGFVGVHFPPVGRERIADDTPDAEAAQAAMRGYIGYFGTLGVYPGEVTHNILSGVSPGTGSILRRYAEITGDELLVTLQSGVARGRGNGPRTATEVVLRRLSGAEEMVAR